ncbi:hypothetical protein JYT72_03050 [Crocinitomix catalasitica]|nr:hypothetical protein [Crocinitomix catalasitica]
MNKILIAGLIVLGLSACITNEVVTYEYRSTTMMGKTTITINKDSLTIDFMGRGEPFSNSRSTTEGEWEALAKALADIKLEDVPTFEAPSSLRDTDAAPFGTLFLHTKDTTYKSKTFDGYNSHDALQPLMDVIKKMVERK